MKAFLYEEFPCRVVFWFGTIEQLRPELDRMGLGRVLVLCGANHEAHAQDIARKLGDQVAGLFTNAAMHTPVDVTEAAVAHARDLRVDGLVAVGGGSAIGLAKAIALRTDLPQLAIPVPRQRP